MPRGLWIAALTYSAGRHLQLPPPTLSCAEIRSCARRALSPPTTAATRKALAGMHHPAAHLVGGYALHRARHRLGRHERGRDALLQLHEALLAAAAQPQARLHRTQAGLQRGAGRVGIPGMSQPGNNLCTDSGRQVAASYRALGHSCALPAARACPAWHRPPGTAPAAPDGLPGGGAAGWGCAGSPAGPERRCQRGGSEEQERLYPGERSRPDRRATRVAG